MAEPYRPDIYFVGMSVDRQVLDTLSKECEFTFYAASSGPGGQNVNKVATAVRLRHRPTDIQIRCKTHKSQTANKSEALRRLVGKICERNKVKPERIDSEPSKASVEKRLKKKKQKSNKKKMRKPVRWEG